MTWLTCFTTLFLLCGDVSTAFEFRETNCNTAKPDGITVDASLTQAPFSISMESTTYSPGVAYTVTIQSTGASFQNAMIMTVCGWCPSFGVFEQKTTPSTVFNCGGLASSGIIASMNAPMTSYSVLWTPEDKVADKLRFTATVVYNDTVWWSGVESDEYRRTIVPAKPPPTDPPTEPPPTDPPIEPAPTDPLTEPAPTDPPIEHAPTDPLTEPAPTDPPIEHAPTDPLTEPTPEATRTSGSGGGLVKTVVNISSQVITVLLGVFAFL